MCSANASSSSSDFIKSDKIKTYPKIAHGAMLGKQVVLKIAKEKVNKNFMLCIHNIKLFFDTPVLFSRSIYYKYTNSKV